MDFEETDEIELENEDDEEIDIDPTLTDNIDLSIIYSTTQYETIYEKIGLISKRAEQLEQGCNPYIEIQINDNPISIATREYELGLIPLTINRRITYQMPTVTSVDHLK